MRKPIVAEAFHIIKVHFREKGQERGTRGWKSVMEEELQWWVSLRS